jgi:predicted nucleotidyltransferase
MLIIKRIRDYKSSLPNSIIKIILQVKKELTLKNYLYILLKARVARLKAANNTISKCKKCKKK